MEVSNVPFGVLVDIFFLGLLLVYSIFTFVIFYHWRNFATNTRMTSLTLSSYFFITVPLLICLGVLALLIK